MFQRSGKSTKQVMWLMIFFAVYGVITTWLLCAICRWVLPEMNSELWLDPPEAVYDRFIVECLELFFHADFFYFPVFIAIWFAVIIWVWSRQVGTCEPAISRDVPEK